MEQWQLSAGMFITSKTQGVYVMASDDPEGHRKQLLIHRSHTIKARHPVNQLKCALSFTPHNSPGEQFYHRFSYTDSRGLPTVTQPVNGQTYLCTWVVSDSKASAVV